MENIPYMDRYTDEMGMDEDYNVIGRKNELISLDANMLRARMNSILLLAPAGAGKTAVVESWARYRRNDIRTFSVDLVAMGAQGENEFAARIKQLIDEVIDLSNHSSKEICLFIDEVHMLGMENYAVGLESLKPAMARGKIKLIGATTDEEYVQYIQPNQALNQRFQRFDISEPSDKIVLKILQDMWKKELGHLDMNNELLKTIIDYGRFFPADAQPRKSIKLLDDMIGWHRSQGIDVNERLLDNRVYATAGINPKWKVDVEKLIENIKKRVKGQDHAVQQIEGSLNIAVAGFSSPKRPMGTFLFTGSTGVGKPIDNNELVPVSINGQLSYKKHGELKVGDYVYNRKGQPVKVTQVFSQGLKRAFRISFADQSSVICGGGHLWTYKNSNGNGSKYWKTDELRTIMEKGISRKSKNGRTVNKFKVPVNETLSSNKINYQTDPYLVGAFIGNGCLREDVLTLSSNDRFINEKVKNLLNASDIKYLKDSYSLCFNLPSDSKKNKRMYYYTSDVFSHLPELYNKYSHEKSIPDIYKQGSVEQRWALIQGLFDTDGSISKSNGRYNVRYDTTSKKLAKDIREVLNSLGFMSTMTEYQRGNETGLKNKEYVLKIKAQNKDKHLFFSTPIKKNIAIESQLYEKEREKKYDSIHITSIEDLGYESEMSCIMVDDSEHLYCVTKDFIVTHNTEFAKSMAEGLFGSEDNLIRFDMSEFQTLESVDVFRFRISDAINKKPYAIVLLDEIEKAHPGVVDLLLQITDDGRLTDRYGRQVTFRNAYIILTTNVGHQVYQESHEQSEDVTKMVSLIQKSLMDKFRPEMLGRIDAIVPFKPLSKNVRHIIGMTRLDEFSTMLAKENIQLHMNKRTLVYLTEESVSRDTTSGGGRDLNRRIKQELYVPVAKLFNTVPNVCEVKVAVFGEMAKENKQQLQSRANLGIINYYVHLDNGGYMYYEGNVEKNIEATDEDATMMYVSEEEYQAHKDRLKSHLKKVEEEQRIEEA